MITRNDNNINTKKDPKPIPNTVSWTNIQHNRHKIVQTQETKQDYNDLVKFEELKALMLEIEHG